MRRLNITDLVAGVIPWASPLPTAWLIGAASMRWLGWPLPVAIVAAVIVEALGLSSIATTLTLWDYNRARRKVDPAAPAWLAGGLVAVYFLTAVTLTVALDIQPELARYAPALFPLLSLCGMGILALRSDHQRRLESIVKEKAERKAERQAARQASSVNRKAVKRSVNRQVSSVNLDRLIDIYRADPLTGPTEASQALGVSRQAIYDNLTKLEAAGRIRRNGHGIEVLE